jgi:hypothetical protein
VKGLFLTTLFLSVFGTRAEASTQAFFHKDGQQASVVLMGMPGDSDPAGFYGALNVAPEDFQGKWSKKLSLANREGGKAWDAACVFSKMIEGSGTCTLVFRAAEGLVTVDRAAGRAQLMLTGEEAARFAEKFNLPETTNFIYRSKDGRLQLSFVREEGRVTWLVADWNGSGTNLKESENTALAR